MKRNIICTVCPMGCRMTVEGEGTNITKVEGFTCKRGEEYAKQEFVCPVRILTSTVKTDSASTPLLPVRSDGKLPKDIIIKCMEVLRSTSVKAPVKSHDVIIENICDTGINIIASGSLE